MITIGYNGKGISSVGHYREGMTKLEPLKVKMPDGLLKTYNQDTFWTKAFGVINEKMPCYKLQYCFVVDTENHIEYP